MLGLDANQKTYGFPNLSLLKGRGRRGNLFTYQGVREGAKPLAWFPYKKYTVIYMTTYIEPYDQILTFRITHISIAVSNLTLNQQATIITSFYDESNEIRRKEVAILEGTEYNEWETDDYITQWVMTKYGLKPLPM
jgi:hypothetical protein